MPFFESSSQERKIRQKPSLSTQRKLGLPKDWSSARPAESERAVRPRDGLAPVEEDTVVVGPGSRHREKGAALERERGIGDRSHLCLVDLLETLPQRVVNVLVFVAVVPVVVDRRADRDVRSR